MLQCAMFQDASYCDYMYAGVYWSSKDPSSVTDILEYEGHLGQSDFCT